MSEVTIYHNPRCSKSRQTLDLLKERNIEPSIVLYLETPPDKATLSAIISMLGIEPRDLLRTSEAEYKEMNLKDKSLGDDDLIEAMVQAPKLIQRPIVLANGKAAIGRPPESVLEII
ncbi:MAG: arsenate reductase (glutaredoxin) [Pseudomonadales bacterium]|nr:arsenate reductase (glutaredoxin) [Pseudomonadales bacterium]